MVDKRTLNAIQAADPDGGETEPTEADYARHKTWAIESFGIEAWDAYRVGGWDDPADWREGDFSHLSEDFSDVQVTGQGTLFAVAW